MAILFVTGFNTGGFLFLTVGLLELEPQYLCRDPADPAKGEFVCKSDDICSHSTWGYRINENYYLSLHNWVEDLGLLCSKSVGLIGSLYFFGYTSSAFILPRLSDMFGRKIIYQISMTGHLLTYGALILSRNLYLTIVLMYIFGFFSLGRASVGYLYM
jgi:MFS family permease